MSDLPSTPGSVVACAGVMAMRGMDGEWYSTNAGFCWRNFGDWWREHEHSQTVVYVPAVASAIELVERIEAALAPPAASSEAS